MLLKDRFGSSSLQHMPADVLEAAQTQKNDKVLPHGVVDYLRFPEIAEMSGFVFPRTGSGISHRKLELVQDPAFHTGSLKICQLLPRASCTYQRKC